MNPKLLMCLFLGIKSAFLFPMVSQAAVSASPSNQPNRQSAIEMDVVNLSQSASQSVLIADRNDNRRNNDNRRSNDNRRDNDNARRLVPIRVQQPIRYRTPIRVQHPVRVVRPIYGLPQVPVRYPNRNNDSGGVRVRIGF
ncbi:hypothetical protein AB3R30_17665 [Leptolyngbyaceae cyanobacterium UHCC 1019]